MPEIKNNFLKGKMNKDADERIVGTGEYKDALNIQVGVAENGDAGSVHNVLGNIQIDSLNISGAYSLGTVADTQTDKIYWFIYGTSVDAIAEYDEATDTVSPVLVDATKKILNFPANQITAANVIEGYLIYTDDNSEPKNIDIELFKSGSTNFSTTTQIYDDLLLANRDIQESDITLIKKKPASAPVVLTSTQGKLLTDSQGSSITVSVDMTGATVGTTELVFNFSAETNLKINDKFIVISNDFLKSYECKVIETSEFSANLTCIITNAVGLFSDSLTDFSGTVRAGNILFENKFVRFAYRWKFKNNQYSVMSPFTETVFYPKFTESATAYSIDKGYNDKMENSIKSIELYEIDCSDTNIESVDILYKESNNTNIYVYKTVRKEDLDGYGSGFLPGNCNITIDSESFYTVLPDNQLFRQYDDVPYRAKASEIVANRVLFANYENGLNVIKNSTTSLPAVYSPSFNISTGIRDGADYLKSIKSGRTYQFGILFEDEYGRQTPVSSNDTGSFNISFNDLTDFTSNLLSGDGIGGREFKVSMSPLPSGFEFDDRIKKFKYYIKEQSKEYYNVVVDSAYYDSSSEKTVWLSIPSYEINKFNEDDFLILKRGASSVNPINDSSAKYKVLDIKSSKPSSISEEIQASDRFFVKIEKNDLIEKEILSKSGTGGSSSLITEESFILTTIPITGGLYLGSICVVLQGDDRGDQYKYWFKDGNVYVQNNSCDQDGTTLSGSTITSDVVCGDTTLLVSDGWEQTNTSLFEDSTGSLTAYARPVYNGQEIEVFICYESGSNSVLTVDSKALFETIPGNNILDLYYETEKSYDISEYTQPKTLKWFNCFDFGNGVESDRIKDEFNEVTIENQVRVSTIVEDGYKQKRNKYGFIFSSGLFNSRNGVNDINQFNVAEAITKDLNPEYGSIQKIHTRNTDVVTFCEDKVLRILANKDALFNADGNANLTSVNAVLGQAIPYAGEYGISTNPESFASHGYQIYFTDRARNAVLRLSRDGLTVISNYGMSDFFRDKFNLLTTSESISFREGVDGWTSRLSFVPETGVSLNGNYYTLKNGELWKHHAPGVGYNNFYGTQYNSTLNFIYNQDPSFRKGFKTLNYEGTSGWTAASIETDQQSGKVDYFINKEGKWFNNIKGIANVTNDLDTKEFSIQGLGNITGFTIS